MVAIPTYSIYVDWDNDGGLDVGNFETSTDDWAVNSSAGTTTAALSTAQSHLGDQCLLVTWNNVSSPKVQKTITGLTSGASYTYSAWVYIPTGDAAVRISVQGVANSSNSTTNNAWEQISVAFTATGSSHIVDVNVNGTPANGDLVYLDQAMVTSAGEDVSGRVLGLRTPLSFSYGRDQARSLSAIKPGEIQFELNNMSKDYSPDYSSSPLYGKVRPGRPVLVRATHNGHAYDLFRGYLDDFTLDPSRDKKSLTVSALDVLQKLADAQISTELFDSLQTGEAIGKVLDAIGWPTTKRDLDPGASTVRWWWEEGSNALDAVNKLVSTEGPPAFAYVSEAGNFVFRSRHHRFIRSASKTSQATFRGTGSEPLFSEPMTYDIGWRDLVNDITVDVTERDPGEFGKVWTSDDVISLATGETREIKVQTDNPFYSAIAPVAGTDYTLLAGTVSISISRSSGQSLSIFITCTAAAVIKGLSFRAVPVAAGRSYQVHVQDQTSINEHGIHSLDDLNLQWAGLNDAQGIAATILSLRSERLPIVTISLVNANATRTAQILGRGLSDRITIIENETSLNSDFYIEQIQHNVGDVGHDHRVVFGCEKVQGQNGTVFKFGTAGAGFDQGSFAIDGYTDNSALFILGTSQLDTGLLGY
ncbi:carbohydrate binding domain-containing protein [Streptomyces sp. NPDC101150]|uniref:carbohydrate binding domain-containing protein n=1 Tax=Streptomyces sp. NPDC101150 TaxID=3366114 RepID=UPI0037FDB14A